MNRRTFGCVGLGGCLTTLGIVVLTLAFVAGIGFFILNTFKSSPVYTAAMQAARADSRVTQALGTPIDSGWFITGSIQEQGISGDANLVIPISGPRGSGTLYAAAREGNGRWQFYTLAVRIDGQNELIQLQVQ